MDGYIWLGAERIDRSGSTWPEPGEFVNDAVVLRSHEVLLRGVDVSLWKVRFDGPPRDVPDGLLGRVTLDGEVERWSDQAAQELRTEFFEVARAGLARILVSPEAREASGALPDDVVAAIAHAGRKVAGASSPAELGVRIKDLAPLVQKLWPPAKKKGMFAKKVDSTLMYENLRKALKSALEATQEMIQGTGDAEVIAGANRQVAACSRFARAETLFTGMLRASQSPDQAALDVAIERSREAVKSVASAGVASNPSGLGGWSGGFGHGDEPSEYQMRPDDDAVKPDLGVDRSMPLPLAEATRWLAVRVGLQIDVTKLPATPTQVVAAVAAPAASAATRVPAAPARASSGDRTGGAMYVAPESAGAMMEASSASGHIHSGPVGSHDDLVRHVEKDHGERAGIYGTIQLRKKHDEWHVGDPEPQEVAAPLPPTPSVTKVAAETPAPSPGPAAPAVPAPVPERAVSERADTTHAASTYIAPSATAPIHATDDEVGHAHTGSVGSHDDLVRHVEKDHAERAGIYGTIQLRKIHEERHAEQSSDDESEPAADASAASAPEPDLEDAAPEPGVEPEPKLEAGSQPDAESELEPSANGDGNGNGNGDGGGEPLVFVVPDSPAGIESATPGPEEPSSTQRAVAAAQAEKPVRSYPGPLVAHTHDEKIESHEDLTRHVEVIHGIPVGKVDRDALVEIHDGSHAIA